jgi:hypothetical protein
MSVEVEDFSEFFNTTTKENEGDYLPKRISPTTQSEQVKGALAGTEEQFSNAADTGEIQESVNPELNRNQSDDGSVEAPPAAPPAAPEEIPAAPEEIPAAPEEIPAAPEEQPSLLIGDKLYEKYKEQKDFGVLSINMSDYLKNDDINAFRSSLVQDTSKLQQLEDLKIELKKLSKSDTKSSDANTPYWFETEDGKNCEELLEQVFRQFDMTYTKYSLDGSSSSYKNNIKKLQFLKTIFFLYKSDENPTCDEKVKECVDLCKVILEAEIFVTHIPENVSILSPIKSNRGISIRGGSKSRRKPVYKTRRGRKSKSKSKPNKRQRNMQKRTRKHKKYTSRRR